MSGLVTPESRPINLKTMNMSAWIIQGLKPQQHARTPENSKLLHYYMAFSPAPHMENGENSMYYYTLGWRCWYSWH